MGNNDSKLSTYRAAINELTGRQGPAPADDEAFWSQFWHDNHIEAVGDVFTVLTAAEIRALRDHHPENLATLCYKAVEQLVRVTDTLCNTVQQQKTVLSCVALLTRLLPYVFEEADWRASFFWSTLPSPSASLSSLDDAAAIGGGGGSGSFHGASFYRKHYQQQQSRHHSSHQMDLLANMPLAQSLLLALADLLFCPDFTVAPLDSTGSGGKDSKSGSSSRFGVPDSPPDDLQSIDSCEYIWEAGVGCSMSSPSSAQYDHNRTALLRLLLTCFSESMYCSTAEVGRTPNAWIDFFSSAENRHALPLFTSLLNTVFAYNPNGGLLPFNHLLFSDSKEPLVEVALQLLIVILDHDFSSKRTTTAPPPLNQERPDPDPELQDTRTTMAYHTTTMNTSSPPLSICSEQSPLHLNLFINYLSRIHREDDFEFLLRGFTRLLNNPLAQSYLPNSNKRIAFHQELLVLFWKLCDYNKKFMHYVLKTCDVLQILVPILYHLNDARADRSRVGLVHIGVFILLLLSGERNFGVRLNRPYLATAPMDLPIFSGTHADLLVVVFHKLITTGHTRLQPLFDCLLTILVNVSPYLKTLSMVAAAKVLHLLEAFSTPWFLFSNPSNHHLVFFLLEIFNNIIQYQFDGNANLMYTIIKKRHAFHALANLPTDYGAIQRSLSSATNAAASSSSSASAGSLRRSSSSRVAGGHSRKHQPHRPHSLIERASSQPPEQQYPYAHSQYMVGNGKGSGKSAPTSPHTDYPPPDTAMIDESGRNLEKPPSQATIDGGGPLEGHSRSIGPGEQNTNTMAAAAEAEMNVTLAAVPKIDSMTERMHPNTVKTEEEEEEGDEGPQYEPEFEYRGDMVTPLSDIVRREGAMARKSQSISRQSSTASERTSVSTSTRNQQHQQQQAPMPWAPTSEWIQGWKQKLPLQTIMRMLQVRGLVQAVDIH